MKPSLFFEDLCLSIRLPHPNLPPPLGKGYSRPLQETFA